MRDSIAAAIYTALKTGVAFKRFPLSRDCDGFSTRCGACCARTTRVRSTESVRPGHVARNRRSRADGARRRAARRSRTREQQAAYALQQQGAHGVMFGYIIFSVVAGVLIRPDNRRVAQSCNGAPPPAPSVIPSALGVDIAGNNNGPRFDPHFARLLKQTSNAFSPNTSLVLISASSSCSIVFGTTPIAADTNMRLMPGRTYRFGVVPFQKLAVIA